MRRFMKVGLWCLLICTAGTACRPPVSTSADLSDDTAGTVPDSVAVPDVERSGATERVVAGVGVGRRSRSLDKRSGPVVEPLKSLVATKERLAFDVQLKQAMNLYQATHGRLPQSHDEFMTQIVAFNKIKLPALPAGHKYLFDPQRGELMVERPVR
ncbi:MAG: hypothetical protein VX346_22960 [Planctomycetota bacterium]|nr:hypothetical protein [Planctomycetota bacterium]